MSKSTIIRLIAILLCVFAIITLVELLFKTIAKRNAEPKGELIITTEEGDNIVRNEVEDNFISETDTVVELLKQRDYEAIYSKINSIYKKIKYPTLEDFKKSMDEIIHEDSTIEISNMVSHPKGYYATILIDNERELDFTVKTLVTDDIEIMFDKIYMIYEMDKYISIGDVTVDFEYCMRYLDRVVYVLKIKNESKKSIKCGLIDMYEYSTSKLNKKQYEATNSVYTTLQAKETQEKEIEFMVPSGELYQPDRMHVVLFIDGDVYENMIDVSISDQYFSM